jgi:hypothetical protein
LGIGGCIAFGFEQLNTSFRDPEEIESFLGVPVLCAVPQVAVRSEKVKARMAAIVWSVVFIISLCGVGALFVYMWKKGMIIL